MSHLLFGQDSLKTKNDSISLKNKVNIDTLRGAKFKSTLRETKLTLGKSFGVIPFLEKDIPKIAFVRSLFVPGWGQITNKQFFKLPLVYGAAGVGAYFIYSNNKKYQTFKGYLLDMNEKNLTELLIDGRGPYSISLITTAANQYRRWKQGTLIGFSLGWLLFAIEANASAHLKSFDVSDDISLKTKPLFFNQNIALGIALELNFKK